MVSLFDVSFTEDTFIGLGFVEDEESGGYRWMNGARLTYSEWSADEAEERCVVVSPDAQWRSVTCANETTALCSDDGISHFMKK